MRPLFNKIRVQRPRSNSFDLSHERKLSLKMGDLVPICLEETIPGDKFRVNTEVFARIAPMVAPMMHRVNCYVHWFHVPMRLVWSNYEKFITGGADGLQTAVKPKLLIEESTKGSFGIGSLADHLGVPAIPSGVTVTGQRTVDALPFRAYQLIYNDYYRDQTLIPEIAFNRDDTMGSDQSRLVTLRKRCWEKDYFTSALPFAQRGGAVTIPSVIDYHMASKIYNGTSNTDTQLTGSTTLHARSADASLTGTTPYTNITAVSGIPVRVENVSGVNITINDLRKATRLQQWLERNARGGARLKELLFNHFGVESSDARLDRAEYLGGNKQPIVISEVLSTNSADGEDPLGSMAGHGVSVSRDFAFNTRFEEHGYVIGIMSVIPRTSYFQGLPRIFSKFDKFDYFWPEFAQLGEQEVKQQELYINYNAAIAADSGTFGYQSRYAEYKFKESSIHGEFRNSLKYWHMAREFSSAPALNESFVTADPTTRIFAVQDGSDHIYVQLYNDFKAIRPMPVFADPIL